MEWKHLVLLTLV